MTYDPQYEIVKSYQCRDSLDQSTLTVNVLRNGTLRIVAAIDKKDGIAEHHVYELNLRTQGV